jgi:MtrB/PioB family decaheme-associated outer membrane protein
VFPTGWFGDVGAGLGYIGEDAFRFGDYTGMEDKGIFIDAHGDLRWRDDDANYFRAYGRNLGLYSRTLQIEQGKQGTYDLRLDYQGIPHRLYDATETPFSGVGTARLRLPGSWVPGGTPSDMPGLNAALHPVNIETDRQRLGLSADLLQSSDWKYSVDFHHDKRDGQRIMGSSFLISSTLLPAPVDDSTNQVDAAVNYMGDDLQVQFGYYGSYYRQGDTALVWDNPFTPYNSGATRGRMALMPDNNFHQLMAAATYRFGDTTWANASLAMGRVTQDENFIPATTNNTLTTDPLPRASLDGEIKTLSARGRVTTRPVPRLGLTFRYNYDKRDNTTAQATWQQVGTDVYVGGDRVNTPYSFRHGKWGLDADYRFGSRSHFAAGYEHQLHQYDYVVVDSTDSNEVWAQVRSTALDSLAFRAKVGRENRNSSGDQPWPADQPAQNPLLSLYNLADRDRQYARAGLTWSATDTLSFDLSGMYANDDYSESVIGLTSDRQRNYTLDAGYMPMSALNLHAYYSWEQLNSNMANSGAFSAPDWFASQEDLTRNIGLGGEWADAIGKLDLGLNANYARSEGRIDLVNLGAASAFPNLVTRLYSGRLYARYPLPKAFTLRFDFWVESYHSANWQIDGVYPTTISNVLTMNAMSPDYVAHVFLVGFDYRL